MYKQSEKVNGKIVKTRLGALWKGMKARVKANNKGTLCYSDVKVSEEFNDFQNFARWASSQFNVNFKDSKGNYFDLDKDLLFPELNLYSKETCVFLPKKINLFLRHRVTANKTLPVGVFSCGSSFKVSSTDEIGRYVYLGTYRNQYDAEQSYLQHKIDVSLLLAKAYKDVISPVAYESLINFYRKENE